MSPAVARAMSAQLVRVNESPDRLKERIAELEGEVAKLQTLLQVRDRRQQGGGNSAPVADAAGRELIPPSIYARRIGKSVSTINRALNAVGHYRLDPPGIRQPNGRWLVVADARLISKRSR